MVLHILTKHPFRAFQAAYEICNTICAFQAAYEMAGEGGDADGIYGLAPSFDAGSSIYEMVSNKRLYENSSSKSKDQPAAPGGLYLKAKKDAADKNKAEKGVTGADEESEDENNPLAKRLENILSSQSQQTFKDDQGGTYDQQMIYQQVMYESSDDPNLYTDEQTSSHRNSALKELCETERNFNKVLSALVNVYFKRINEHPELFSEADKAVLFPVISRLTPHSLFYSALSAPLYPSMQMPY